MLSSRQLILLFRTISYSLGTGVFVALIGFFAVSTLWTVRKTTWHQIIKPLLLLSGVMIFVPSYVYALAWQNILLRFNIYGLSSSFWVMAMALTPLGIGFSALGFYLVDSGSIEAARVFRKDTMVFRKIIFPLGLPAFLAGSTFAFIWATHDFSVPSLFFVNIYALEIFAKYSATNNPVDPLMLSIPMMIITLSGIIAVSFASKKIDLGLRKDHSKDSEPLQVSRGFKTLQFFALLIILGQVIIPISSLLQKVVTPRNILVSIQLANRELQYTLVLALLTAFISLLVAVLLGYLLTHKPFKKTFLWWFILLVPLAVPAPLVGIGVIYVFNRPALNFIYGSIWMPVLVNFIRFAPLAFLAFSTQLKRLDQPLLQAAKVFQKNRWHGFLKIILPMISPGLLASFLIVFILTIGELGATLIVIPAGRSTITMRIYNYMHYGSSHLIAGLCLAILGVSLLIGIIILVLLKKQTEVTQ